MKPINLKSTTLIIILIITSCTGKRIDIKIREAIELELKHFPEATLQDLYKNFFQDAFGPGHLIPDTARAMKYLEYELENAETFSKLEWQPLGYKHNYYRVNLSLVKERKLPGDSLFRAFVASANTASPPSIEEWKKQWSYILSVIEQMNLNLKDFEEDKKYLDELLEKGHYVVHHSDTYRELYHPHYRIVSRKKFSELGIKALDRK